MTISITVLVMETTGSMQLIIPLMLTIFFAKAIGDKYSMGIYDTHIKIRGAPFLDEPEHAGVAVDKLKVAEVMADSLVTLRPVMRVSELVEVLTNTSHGAFPVTTTDVTEGHNAGDPIELHGSITRNLLLKMLTHRVSMFDPEEPREVLYENSEDRDALLEKLKQIPFKSPGVEMIALAEARRAFAPRSFARARVAWGIQGGPTYKSRFFLLETVASGWGLDDLPVLLVSR